MSERKPLCILAVDPSVSLSRADRDRLRRAGVVVIHAAPDKVPALDPAPILQPRVVSSEAFLRAAVETLNANWNFVNGDKLRSISESSYSIPHFAPRPKTPMSSPSSPSLAVGMRCIWTMDERFGTKQRRYSGDVVTITSTWAAPTWFQVEAADGTHFNANRRELGALSSPETK